jgi:hypothetical protein
MSNNLIPDSLGCAQVPCHVAAATGRHDEFRGWRAGMHRIILMAQGSSRMQPSSTLWRQQRHASEHQRSSKRPSASQPGPQCRLCVPCGFVCMCRAKLLLVSALLATVLCMTYSGRTSSQQRGILLSDIQLHTQMPAHDIGHVTGQQAARMSSSSRSRHLGETSGMLFSFPLQNLVFE